MNCLSVLYHNSINYRVAEESLNKLWSEIGISVSVENVDNYKSKVFLFTNNNSLSEFNSEEVFIESKAMLYLLPVGELPYPLNDKLEVFSVVEIKNLNQAVKSENSLNNFLAIVGKKHNAELKQSFTTVDVRKKWGSVALAGFGPGDQHLITKKAELFLYRSEVIFYDDLVNEEYLRRFCAKKVYVGKRKGKHKFDQEKINELMYQEAVKGKWVVRIKGGDPLIFGRGAEEYHYLKRRLVDAEIVPGISSAFAAAATAVIPLTERSLSSSVTLLSGHDLHKLKIPQTDTLVFYMGASHQKELAGKIIAEGWDENTPVAVVHNVSNSKQKEYRGTLEELKKDGSGLPSPSIIVVGKTAGSYYGQNSSWLYTGASLEELKSTSKYVHTPLISIEAADDSEAIDEKIINVSFYDRIVFTSRYAVSYFFERLFYLGKDARDLYGITIDSIGKTTSKALKSYGLAISPLSEKESVQGLLDVYGKLRVEGENVLIPCSDESTGAIQKGLRRLNNRVTEAMVYKVVKNKAIIKQNLSRFEGVVFSSPATVHAFFEVYNHLPAHLKVKCRGSQIRKLLDQYLNEDASHQLAV